MILRASSSTPITPVEEGSTCVTGSRSSLAAALQVASATASPVRVAQLALPALISTAPHRPLDALQMAAAQAHRRGLHAVLREDGGGVGRQAADDQRQIVLFHLRGFRRRWWRMRIPAEASNAWLS